MRRGSVVIEGCSGNRVISGKARDDFYLPLRLAVEFDGGGGWFTSLPISSKSFRRGSRTKAKAFGCINCKEIVVVDDHGRAVKIGFTRVDEYERQAMSLINEELWIGGI